MKITYDKSVDAAYIYLAETSEKVASTYLCDPKEAGMINLDFDKNKILIGIEILDAAKTLSKEILEQAEIIG